jgi:hypothetical protein
MSRKLSWLRRDHDLSKSPLGCGPGVLRLRDIDVLSQKHLRSVTTATYQAILNTRFTATVTDSQAILQARAASGVMPSVDMRELFVHWPFQPT